MKVLKRATAMVLCLMTAFSVVSIYPDAFFEQVFAASADRAETSAEEIYEYEDFTYTLGDEYAHVFIKSYKGSDSELVIPDTIDGKEVTRIGNSVFNGNKTLTSVTIGANVEVIGTYAFNGCTSLEKVVFNKKLKTINERAFYEDKKLSELAFPDSLEVIGEYAFRDASALKKLTFGSGIKTVGTWAFGRTAVEEVSFPKSIQSIGYAAFYECHSLKSVSIEEGSSAVIDGRAFHDCSALASLTLGEGVKTIGNNAFYNCDKVEELIIPDSVTTIGERPFEYMDSLKKVTLGKGLTSIHGEAFFASPLLEEITVSADNETYKSIDGVLFTKDGTTLLTFPNGKEGEYTVPDSVTKIATTAFINSKKLTSVIIGDNVAELSKSAFEGCTALEGVAFGKNIKTIPDSAFSGCKALKSVTIGENVETIGNYAFHGCTSLEKVVFNDKLTTIKERAFYEDKMISELDFPDSLELIEGYAFTNASALKKLTFGSGIKTVGTWAFARNAVEEVSFPKSIENIYYAAFYECHSLKSISFEEGSSAVIDARAFNDCSALASLTLGEGVKTIGNNAFYNCDKVEELVIPDSVTTIGERPFEYMDSLKKVTLGKGLTSIHGEAFFASPLLEEITVSADNETYKSVDGVLFTKDGTTLLTYPNGKEGEYTVPDSVTKIATTAFINSKKLTSVIIGDNVTELSKSAFEGCTALEGVAFGKNIKTIPDSAFSGCKALKSVTIGENVETIGNYAFLGCTSLEKVVFNDKLTTIKERAFYEDKMISELDFPDSLEVIEGFAFTNASSLKKLTFGSGIKTVGTWAFARNAVEEVSFPKSIENIYYAAFYECHSLKSISIEEGSSAVIDARAFHDCTALASLTLGEGVKSIGNNAFNNGDKVEEIVIPDSVTSIGDGAFEYMDSLTTLTIGKGVKSFPVSAITGCNAIARINVSEDNETYKSIDNVVLSKDGTSIYIFPKAYAGEYTLPDTVTSISNKSFVNCKKLTGIKIGSGVAKISAGAFEGCTALETLDAGTGVTAIDDNAFRECKSLRSVNIGKNTETIGNYAFYNCTELETVDFGEKLKKIGYHAFENNRKLSEIEFPDTVEMVGDHAFKNDSAVKSLYLGTSLQTIDQYAFETLSNITTVSLPDTIKTIARGAFYNCDSLETIYIYGEEAAIDPQSFYDSDKLSTIYVPENSITHQNILKINDIDKLTIKFLSLNFFVKNLKNSALASHSATISWSKPDGYDDIAKYIVYRNDTKLAETEKTQFSDDKLTEGKTYKYAVSAVNSEGVESEKKEIEVTPKAAEIASLATPNEDNVIGGTKPVKLTAVLENAKYYENGTAVFSYSDDGNTFEEIPDAVLTGDHKTYYTYWDLKTVKSGEYTLRFEFTDRDSAKSTLDIKVTVDRTAPEMIQSLAVQGREESILLTWDMSAEIDTTIYRIYRKSDQDEAFRLISEIRDRETLSYTDTKVEKGILYTYYVVGVDRFNQESIDYTTVPAGVIDDVVAPQVTKLTPAVNSTVYGTYRFGVTAKDNVGVTRIELYYSTDRESWTLLKTASGANFSQDIDTAVMPDGLVYVKAIAYDVAENASNSTPVYAYKVDNSGPVKVTGVESISTLSTIITLSWDKIEDDALYYFQVEQKQPDGSFTEVAREYSTLGTNIRNLTPDTEYTYRVVAYDRYRNRGTVSDEITVKTASDTIAPSVTSITPGAGYFNKDIEVTLTAQDDDKVESMEIQVSTDNKTWKTVKTEKTDSPSYIVKFTCTLQLVDYGEGSVYIRGLAADLMGNKMTEEDASCNEYIFDVTAPKAPANVTAEPLDTSIHIIWDQSESDDMYYYVLSRAETEDGDYEVIAGKLGTVDYYDRRVNQFTKYFYKVQTVDQAGNVSDYSKTVFGSLKDDDEAPEILAVRPSDGETVGPDNAEVGVTASDNIRLYSITAKYSREAEPDSFVDFINEENLNVLGTTVGKELPIKDFKDGEKIKLKVSCKDTTGNSSEETELTITVKNTVEAVQNLSLSEKDGVFTATWDRHEEADGYYIYRKTNLDDEFELIDRCHGDSTGFEDGRYSSAAATVCYKVEVFDSVGNSAEAVTDYAQIPGDVPPTAVLSGPAKVKVNTDYVFSAEGSSDDRGITSCTIAFSDGTTAVASSAVHRFTEAGVYTVTLTVTDTDGNTATVSKQVTVTDKNNFGKIQITVKDGNGSKMPNTPVYLDLAENDETVKYTDANGVVEFEATLGSHTAASYKTDYLPVKKDVVALNGTVYKEELVLVKQPLITGEFEIHRMNLNEIKAAGININSAENQHVVKITVRLNYAGVPKNNVFYWNGTSIVQGAKIRVYDSAGHGRILIPHVFGGSVGRFNFGDGGSVNYQVAYLDVPVEMSVLKEFFDVKLHILNNASPEFSVSNNHVTLNVPDGLTIMKTSARDAESSAHAYIDKIKGQEQKTLRWILRGDKAGSYDISADYFGTLDDFKEPVSAHFASDEKITVYGVPSLGITIETEKLTEQTRVFFNIVVTNNASVPYYNFQWKTKLAAFGYEFVSADGIHHAWDGKIDILLPGESLIYHYKSSLTIEGTDQTIYDHYKYINHYVKESSKNGASVSVVLKPSEYFLDYVKDFEPTNTDKFTIHVIDSQNKPISGARISLDDKGYVTDGNGDAEIEIPRDTSAHLKIHKEKYHNIDKPYYNRYHMGSQDTIKMFLDNEKCVVSEVIVNECDILTQEKAIDVKNEFDYTFHINVFGEGIKSVDLAQNKTDIIKAEEKTEFDGTYVNTYSPSKFKESLPLYVVVTFESGEQSEPVKLKARVVNSDNFPNFGKYDFNTFTAFTFTIPDRESVPEMFRGQKFTFNWTKCKPLSDSIKQTLLPISVKTVDGELFVGLNIPFSADLEKRDAVASKFLGKVQDSLREKLFEDKEAAKSLSLSGSLNLAGYLVFSINEFGEIKLTGSAVYLTVLVSGSYGTTIETPIIIPVSVEVTVYLNAQIGVKFDVDLDNMKFGFGGFSFSVGGSIDAMAGLGVNKVFEGGVYGTAGGTFYFDDQVDGKFGLSKLRVTGEMGLYLRALGFLVRKKLLSGSHDFLDKAQQQLNDKIDTLPSAASINEYLSCADNYTYTDLDTSFAYQTWNGEAAAKSSDVKLYTKVNDDAAPKLITSGDTSILIFKGVDKDATLVSNAPALYYSVYDKAAKTWGAPVKLDKNHQADYSYIIKEINGEIYLAYTQSNKEYTANPESLTAAAKDCDVYVSRFNKSSDKFLAPVCVTSEDNYDKAAALTELDGSPAVVWVNNSDNIPFLLNDKNAIKYSRLDGEAWSEPVTAESNVANIIAIDAGMLSADSYIGYVSVPDGDFEVEDNRTVTLVNISDNNKVIKMAHEISSGSISFTKYSGNDVAVWSQGTSLNCVADSKLMAETLIEDLDPNAVNSFSTAASQQGELALTFEATKDNGTRSIYAYYLDPTTGQFGKPVEIVSSENYAEQSGAAYVDGQLSVVYVDSNIELKDDDISKYSALRLKKVDGTEAMCIDSIVVSNAHIIAGEDVQAKVTVRNISDKQQKNLSFELVDGFDNVLAELKTEDILVSGESKTFDITFKAPYVNYDSEITVKVKDEEYNTAEKSFSLTNCDLTALASFSAFEDSDYAQITVTNNDSFASAGEVQLLNDKGEAVYTRKFMPVEYGEYVTVKLDNITEYADADGYVTVNVLAYGDDTDLLNNTCRIYVGKAEGGDGVLYGDANMDGRLDITDATLIQKYTVKRAELSEEAQALADFNRDGRINIKDVTAIQKFIAG